MFKFLIVVFIFIVTPTVFSVPAYTNEEIFSGLVPGTLKNDPSTDLDHDIMDFIDLIDIEKILAVAIRYINDPEVLNVFAFIFSPDFKELIWDFETMAEFKEAVTFLSSKGYEVDNLVQFINSALDLPPFEILKRSRRSGISGLIEDLISALPLEDMKLLFESKLQNNPEVANLFDIINSQEFIDILKRMAMNPKFSEIKITFESLGFDFKHICSLTKEIVGDYYQGIFCE